MWSFCNPVNTPVQTRVTSSRHSSIKRLGAAGTPHVLGLRRVVRPWLLLVSLCVVDAQLLRAQPTVLFHENMGSPAGNTAVSTHLFENSSELSFAGNADVRTTSASTGYASASGAGNVYLTSSGDKWFEISGISTIGYAPESFTLSFGAHKSKQESNLTELTLAYRASASDYVWVSLPAQPTGSGTAVWRLITLDTLDLPATNDLSLRWSSVSTSTAFRIDDVTLSATAVPEPSAYAAWCAGAMLVFALFSRRAMRPKRSGESTE
ncbi:hypothetical protein Oter_0676 [Opitutus terrae PB90-1]|uniref:PEP-CTERM protein-sorting domain-containing protein n=2 Tax=Opitutus terrae TaxID=107709 RepID=B1ZTM4_OPITP|nr:hypothetical protein Oter_0676 [Opitutus terrae PB90-1]